MARTHLLVALVALAWLAGRTNGNAALDALLAAKERELQVLVDALVDSNNKWKCGDLNCFSGSSDCTPLACESPLTTSTCTTKFGGCKSGYRGRWVDFYGSDGRFESDETFDTPALQDACRTREADAAFLSNNDGNLETPTDLRWQYIGMPSGFLRSYPRVAIQECHAYDPRLRPWYVAATSGDKDVVIAIDTSGSMARFDRLELTKAAVLTVLDTLTIGDHVAVLSFDGDARQLCGGAVPCGTLVQATTSNIAALRSMVSGLQPGGQTNFAAAFELGFSIMRGSSERTSGCHSAFLFLTDGVPTVGLTTTSSLVAKVESLESSFESQTGRSKPVVFSFSLGNSAAVDPPRAMACAGNGIWTSIRDSSGDSLREQMGSYYDYFATLRAASNSVPVWVEPYIDAFGAGELTTVSKAIYDNTTSPPRLVGVAGIDLLTEDIRRVSPDFADTLTSLVVRSRFCPRVSTDTCTLLRLRKTLFDGTEDRSRLCSGDNDAGCTAQVPKCPRTGLQQAPPAGTTELFCSGRRSSFEGEACSGCAEKMSSSSPGTSTGAVVGGIVVLILVIMAGLVYRNRKAQEARRQQGAGGGGGGATVNMGHAAAGWEPAQQQQPPPQGYMASGNGANAAPTGYPSPGAPSAAAVASAPPVTTTVYPPPAAAAATFGLTATDVDAAPPSYADAEAAKVGHSYA